MTEKNKSEVISLSQVAKRYPGGQEVLKDVSLSIMGGEMVFLTGASGAGKTTLLKLIAAIEPPTSGSVIVNGKNVSKVARRAIPFLRRKLGMVFQDHKLLYDRSVFENVILPLRISGFDRSESVKRVRAALDKVGLLSKEKLNPITLSGGEQQRVCIARAVVNRPSLLLADEPTGNLDRAYADDIMAMFQAFNQVGVTAVVATHDIEAISRFPGRVIRLEAGGLQT